MQYNLCNEPWLKYSMQVIADRGLKPSQLTSARLHKEVLYLETARCCPPYFTMPRAQTTESEGSKERVYDTLLGSAQGAV